MRQSHPTAVGKKDFRGDFRPRCGRDHRPPLLCLHRFRRCPSMRKIDNLGVFQTAKVTRLFQWRDKKVPVNVNPDGGIAYVVWHMP